MYTEMTLSELEARIASNKRLLENGSLGRCSRGVAMAQYEIQQCETALRRLKGGFNV